MVRARHPGVAFHRGHSEEHPAQAHPCHSHGGFAPHPYLPLPWPPLPQRTWIWPWAQPTHWGHSSDLCSAAAFFFPFLIPKESSSPSIALHPRSYSVLLGVGSGEIDVFWHLDLPPALKPHPPHPLEHHGRSSLCLETMGPQGNCHLFVRHFRRIGTCSDHTSKSQTWKTGGRCGESSEGEPELRGRRKGSGSWVVSGEQREGHKTQRWARRPQRTRGQTRFRPCMP